MAGYTQVFFAYTRWHYGRSVQEYLTVWSNFIWFLYHFFSISLLSRTLIAPWRRLDDTTRTGFHPEAFFEKFVSNIVVRCIGFFLRVFVILSGIGSILISLVFGFIFFVAWVFLPLVICMLLVVGIIRIIPS